MATRNDECVVPERLQRLHQDLVRLGERSVWHVFLPCLVVAVFHPDRLLAFRLAEIFSKTHTKLPCGVAIEELNDATEEIEDAMESSECFQLARDIKLCLPLDVKSTKAT